MAWLESEIEIPPTVHALLLYLFLFSWVLSLSRRSARSRVIGAAVAGAAVTVFPYGSAGVVVF